MASNRYLLTTDQLELLLAFEANGSLAELAEAVGRDPSVVSRNLQRLADDAAVLEKIKGRWKITSLGSSVNELTKQHKNDLAKLLASPTQAKAPGTKSPNTALIVINAQRALLDPERGPRNNSSAEANIGRLLESWRESKRAVFHVKHISPNPVSAFHASSASAEFIAEIGPIDGEVVVAKQKSSAFSDTSLAAELEKRAIENLVIVGFTANECIDASARHATELGFRTYVISDATAMFDVQGHDGKLHKAERVHQLTLANIHALSATVVDTETALNTL